MIGTASPARFVWLLLTLTACLAASARTFAMIDVRPDSRSVILHATHIFRVRIESSQPGAWAESPPTKKRSVAVVLAIEAIYKGASASTIGDDVKVDIVQVGRTISRLFAVPGAWSEKPLDPGSQYVVFVKDGGTHAARQLAEPEEVYPMTQARPDVELAVAEHAEHLTLPKLVERAKPEASRLGFLFAEYLWSEHGPAARMDLSHFEPVASLLEWPSLATPARASLLNVINSDLDRPGGALEVQDRFARALFRLLEIPEAATLNENVLGVYLPRRLQRNADDVFRGLDDVRTRARLAVGRYAGSVSTQAVVQWLDKRH